MRASLPKMLLAVTALSVVGASLAFVCARGLHFSDPVRPAATALHEPAWPASTAIPSPPVAVEASRPAEEREPQLQTGAVETPSHANEGRATDPKAQLLNGFLGQQRPDGSHSLQIPQMTPDQAAAAARTASDLINGMLANGSRAGSMPIQIDPNQAESAARMLNGLFGGRSLSAEESFGETTRLDPRGDHKHQK